MCRNGHRIAKLQTTVVRRQTAVHGLKATATGGLCAADHLRAWEKKAVLRAATLHCLSGGSSSKAYVLHEIFE